MDVTPGPGEALSDRIVRDINGAMSTMTLYIGLRLGLFEALARAGTATSGQLARQTGLSERYLREWLGALGAGGYLAYDAHSGDFAIPPAHVPVLVEADDPIHTLPFVWFLPPRREPDVSAVPTDTMRDRFTGSGTVVFNELEGGFFGIVGEGGERYDPLNLDDAFSQTASAFGSKRGLSGTGGASTCGAGSWKS